ncbi:ATP-binding protein [Niveispirillum sp. KHB5.9]|uniref:ATP-binding protein n=1 Tax=Niveispirillum sp. KHB5.9 TaxID=3400269 RepID=UPI003A83A28A
MRWYEVRPVRFVIIGVALVGPTASILLALLLAGHVDALIALPALLVNVAVAVAILRMIQSDTRRLTDYAEVLGEASAPLPPPEVASVTAEFIASAMARAHQGWLDRESRDAGRAGLFEAVIDQLPDPVILLGQGREVQRANQAARNLFGDRIMARDLASTVRTPSLLEAADAVLAGGASRSVEVLLPVPVERTLQARVKPFRPPGEENGPLLVLLTLHDITMLKRAEQMRADFVANASHELRTPLAALIGFIETLRGPAKDDPAAHERFLGIMFDQSNRMSRLVNDLLSLSRIEMDEHSPPTTEIDVAKIVRNVAATLELRAASRKVKLRLEQPEPMPPVVGDEDQLSQVFQNLIDNAIKYGKEQTEVTVALTAPVNGKAGSVRGPAIMVAVTDRGDGIARTHLPRLTERFYRVDPARSRALGGTGLGLAIVKHIVNRHRGRLIIDSEVGKGSTFTVVLPAAKVVEGKREAG